MPKPLGYHTSYTPNDHPYLETLEQKYGAYLEQMTKREKLFLVSSLAGQLIDTTTGESREEIYLVAHQLIEKLPAKQVEGVLEALIEQIRWGENATAIHNA